MTNATTPAVTVTPELHERRERVFLVFAGIFLGAMTMLNILGITRFVHIGPLALAVGVLPYPLTFLCTDFISEFYGRRRANFVVWVGFLLNVLVLTFLWLGHQLPGLDESLRPSWQPEGSWTPPPWQTLALARPVALFGGPPVTQIDTFEIVYRCTRGAVLASMIAYLAAQFCDVFLFHFWKRLTRGKHLWLRNNGSTMISQLVDATAVITIVFWRDFISGEKSLHAMLALIGSNYLFKLVIAALDTIPFYLGVYWLKGYLQLDPVREHLIDVEEAAPSDT
ncbi:MAG: VUT family protein [Planctomycetota bacterium]|nr:MAG: VUT family protein [Planctomycetota bacterium]